MRRELIESYYEEYQRELERFLESDPEMFSLEAEIHHYIEILEPVLRDAGQEMWKALDRIISAKNAMEGIVAKEMYIRGFLDNESVGEKMNKRRYSNRRRKNILRVFILLMTIIITVVMWRTIKIDVQIGELTLPKILQSEKSFADTSGEWNLILVDRNHYIPNNYQVELTELSNGKKVDSRIYPELQQMFNDARAEGLALFVREGYRTTEEQQKIMDEKINEYEKQGYSAKEAKKRAEKYVAIPDTSEHQLGLSVDINADTDKCSSEKVYQWLDENAYKYGFVKHYPEDKTDITGISNEPWHYRYVGTTVAKIMKEENLCLEEYLEKYK